MTKENDLKFIKDFTKISISQICKDLKIDIPNLLNGRASEKNTKLVKEELQKRLDSLNE